MGEEKEILLRGNICAYLTCRLMGDPQAPMLTPRLPLPRLPLLLIILSALASTFGGIVLFLKSTQVFNEARAPNTTFASLPYSLSDFVDFSTVKENSFASYAFFNLDAFNVADDHNVRAFRALYVSLNWQCHSDLPWTANCGPGG